MSAAHRALSLGVPRQSMVVGAAAPSRLGSPRPRLRPPDGPPVHRPLSPGSSGLGLAFPFVPGPLGRFCLQSVLGLLSRAGLVPRGRGAWPLAAQAVWVPLPTVVGRRWVAGLRSLRAAGAVSPPHCPACPVRLVPLLACFLSVAVGCLRFLPPFPPLLSLRFSSLRPVPPVRNETKLR